MNAEYRKNHRFINKSWPNDCYLIIALATSNNNNNEIYCINFII